MMLRRHRGMTLVEVSISFVLISILVLIVGGFMTSSYVLSAQMDDLPNAYYGAQDGAEHELDTVRKLVDEKYRLTNEMKNMPDYQITAEMRERLAQINRDLAGYSARTMNLFGGSVEVYEFSKDFTLTNGTTMHLYAGAPNAVTIERPVPIIDDVGINLQGSGITNEVYYAKGREINSTVSYNEKNKKYYSRNMYQWYVSTGDFHTMPYSGKADIPEAAQMGLIPVYPDNFTLIPGATSASLPIKDEYAGKFVACVVTPLSIGGKMGRSVISNFIYVSPLPKLSRGTYQMVIDPSIMSFNYTGSDFISKSEIPSRLPEGVSLISNGSQSPEVSLAGDVTASTISDIVTKEGKLSRYIRFTPSRSMRGNISSSGGGTVFVVAKNRSNTAVDFIHSGGSSVGFGNNTNIYGTGSASRWNILVANIDSINDISAGKQNVDVAELVVVSSPSAEDTTAVVQYLSKKYSIDT